MGEGRSSGMRSGVFAAWVTVTAGVVVAQSLIHLVVVLGTDRIGTMLDLDRSNGVPDIVSTIALGSAAVGAAMVALVSFDARSGVSATLAGALGALTLADALHDGAHPFSTNGWLVIAMVCAAGALLGLIATTSAWRARTTLAVAGCFLVGSFLVNGLDRMDHRFERARGEAIAEYQIVVKEGLELLGWSLVALALWDEALRRRREPQAVPTRRVSRGRAASRRRAA